MDKGFDPFVSNEPPVEIDEETDRILAERIRTAPERLVPADEARKRIQEWLSKSSTTKTP